MIKLHSTEAPARLSEEALGRLFISDQPSIDNFSLLRYKKNFEKLVEIGEANEQDVAALSLVYFNLKEEKKFKELLLIKSKEMKSLSLLASFVMGILYSKWFGTPFKTESDILDFWFNHELNYEKVSLTFDAYIHEFLFAGKVYPLEKTIIVSVEISKERIVTMLAGPLSYNCDFDRIPNASINYQFTKEIVVDVINETFGSEKKAFLEYYMGVEKFSEALVSMTPKKVASFPDRTKFVIASI